MKECKLRKITSYSIDKIYFMDEVIDTLSDYHEYWLYHVNYGVKMFMWGTIHECFPTKKQINEEIKIYKSLYEN